MFCTDGAFVVELAVTMEIQDHIITVYTFSIAF